MLSSWPFPFQRRKSSNKEGKRKKEQALKGTFS
jgi:hypothetical protein